MPEVQHHGFSFEEWVKKIFFPNYKGKYGQKWDIPAEKNKQQKKIPQKFQNIPISIKTAKQGSPIGLGDAMRQHSIDGPFLMIVGFWKQKTPSEKWIQSIGIAHFEKNEWKNLWGNLTASQLNEFDKKTKDLQLSHHEARKNAKDWKDKFTTQSTIIINPKIDSKKQRRIQCSLPFHIFWEKVGETPIYSDNPDLFGEIFPNPIKSLPRTFKKKTPAT